METEVTKIPLTDAQIVALLQMRVRFFHSDGNSYISQAYWQDASETVRTGLTAMLAPDLLEAGRE